VVVVRDSQVVYQRGFGFEYADGKSPMTEQSSLAVGSLTKSFTALAIMQLAEEGRLSLDDPVVRYLPWFRTANREMSDRITVHMLLNNTSGLQAPVIRTGEGRERAAEHLARSLSSVHLNRAPGSSYAYSNDGFAVAGLLVEALSGMSYSTYMDRYIFEPLDMYRSTNDPSRFGSIGTLYGHYQGIHRAIPVHREEGALQEYVAAGSLMRSSAADLGHYLVALLNGGRYHGRQVLSAEGIRELWEPGKSFPGIRVEDGGEGLPFSYGLGWFTGELDGKDYVFHGGNRRNMSSMTFICPEQHVAASFLANIDLTFVDRYHYPNLVQILNNIIRVTLGEGTSGFAVPVVGDPTENTYHLPGELRDSYPGRYRLISGNDWIYMDSRLDIHEGENGLEGEISRGGQVLERFGIDFLTPRTAVSRNLAMPQEMQFSFLRSGQAGSLYISGRKYSRIFEDDLARFEEIVSPDGRIRFQVPRSVETKWHGNAFTARSQDGTQVSGGVLEEVQGAVPGGTVSPDSVFRELFPDLEMRQGGLEFNEVKGSRYWESKAYVTGQGALTTSHYLSVTRGNGKIFAVAISTGGNLSDAVNQWLPAIQDNFEWQE
jgi:CubicO group peptidase (beta-lactamase class C family)